MRRQSNFFKVHSRAQLGPDYESRLSLRQYSSQTPAIASLIPSIIVFLQKFCLLLSRFFPIVSLFKTNLSFITSIQKPIQSHSSDLLYDYHNCSIHGFYLPILCHNGFLGCTYFQDKLHGLADCAWFVKLSSHRCHKGWPFHVNLSFHKVF